MFKKIVAMASSIIVSTICLTGCDFNSNDKKDESS
ncbi:ABC transporter substrate-binding protein, partial [Clostridioides difficile]